MNICSRHQTEYYEKCASCVWEERNPEKQREKIVEGTGLKDCGWLLPKVLETAPLQPIQDPQPLINFHYRRIAQELKTGTGRSFTDAERALYQALNNLTKKESE